MRDLGLPHRASILREWKDTESYAIVQVLLEEESKKAMEALITEGSAKHDTNAGVLRGLGIAMRLADQVILDESRQRPQEAVHG